MSISRANYGFLPRIQRRRCANEPDHKVNRLFFPSRRRDGAGGRLLDALLKHDYDLSHCSCLASTAALFLAEQQGETARAAAEPGCSPLNWLVRETGFGGTSIVSSGAPHSGGPRVTSDHRNRVVLREAGKPSPPASCVAWLHREEWQHPPSATTMTRDRQTFRPVTVCAMAIPGDLRAGRGGRQRHLLLGRARGG